MILLCDPPIFFGYGSLSKKVQQTKTFFIKCDAAGFQFNYDR